MTFGADTFNPENNGKPDGPVSLGASELKQACLVVDIRLDPPIRT